VICRCQQAGLSSGAAPDVDEAGAGVVVAVLLQVEAVTGLQQPADEVLVGGDVEQLFAHRCLRGLIEQTHQVVTAQVVLRHLGAGEDIPEVGGLESLEGGPVERDLVGVDGAVHEVLEGGILSACVAQEFPEL
jgi:hypothetical protein